MKTSKGNKLKIGDLLEVKTSKGLSYIQFVGTHPEYGDVIRVLPGWHEERIQDFASLISESGYLAFYSACAAVIEGLVEIVGPFPLPSWSNIPSKLRRPGVRERSGKILTWIIEDDSCETVLKELTDAEKKLPIAVVWDHELLVLRISQEWNPQKEG